MLDRELVMEMGENTDDVIVDIERGLDVTVLDRDGNALGGFSFPWGSSFWLSSFGLLARF